MKNGEPADRDITPETKVGKLLDLFPELEDTLIRMSPSFEKLRNPVLRRTVAKVATLRQVAKVGGISLADLINTLRREAGLEEGNVRDEGEPEADARPAWFNADRVVRRFDARPMIQSGQQPMGRVLLQIKELSEGEIYELTTPFVPAPLVDLIRKKGYAVWTHSVSVDTVVTYFCRQ